MTQRHPRPSKLIEPDHVRKTINFVLSPLLGERFARVLKEHDFKKHELVSASLEALLKRRDARPSVDLASELDPAVLALIEQVDPQKAARIRKQISALQQRPDEPAFRYIARPLLETERVITYVTQDLKTRIDELANRDGVTLRTLFRTAVTLHIETLETHSMARIQRAVQLQLQLEQELLDALTARAQELEREVEQVALQAVTTWLDEHADRLPHEELSDARPAAPVRYVEPSLRAEAASALLDFSLTLKPELYRRLQRRMGYDMIEPVVIVYTALVETFEAQVPR